MIYCKTSYFRRQFNFANFRETAKFAKSNCCKIVNFTLTEMVSFHFCEIRCLQKWQLFPICKIKFLWNSLVLQYIIWKLLYLLLLFIGAISHHSLLKGSYTSTVFSLAWPSYPPIAYSLPAKTVTPTLLRGVVMGFPIFQLSVMGS